MSEPDRGRSLAQVRASATGLLLALAAVFVATHLWGGDAAWVRLVRSMAEAGMVGGLADWFAVEALFRRRSACRSRTPRSCSAIRRGPPATSGASSRRISSSQRRSRRGCGGPSRRGRLSAWMAGPGNARLVAGQLVALAGSVLATEPSPRALAQIRAWARGQVSGASPEADAALAAGVARLVKDGVRSPLVDEVVSLLRRSVDDGRETAVSLARDRSRWWIPLERRPTGRGDGGRGRALAPR